MNREVIFDAVRKLLGRSFTKGDVALLDAAISAAVSADSQEAAKPLPHAISAKGIALIKQFEGCAKILPDGRVAAYPDPGTGGAPWTIGWGATGSTIRQGTVWTMAQCEERLAEDLARFSREVASALGTTPRTQAQFDALVSFHYNTGAIHRATLTKRHKEGQFAQAAEEFTRWTTAGGRVFSGLVKRRAAEKALYLAL